MSYKQKNSPFKQTKKKGNSYTRFIDNTASYLKGEQGLIPDSITMGKPTKQAIGDGIRKVANTIDPSQKTKKTTKSKKVTKSTKPTKVSVPYKNGKPESKDLPPVPAKQKSMSPRYMSAKPIKLNEEPQPLPSKRSKKPSRPSQPSRSTSRSSRSKK